VKHASLGGDRGHPAADIDALKELLLRISRLAEELPDVAELDLNPVTVLPPGTGCRVIDARIKVGRKATKVQ
jgi:acyl-CoA synthetase (NDP forming)